MGSRGREIIDFSAGIAVLNTGHRHPKVIAAIKEQLDHFTHTAFQVVPYENYIATAEKLNALVPVSGPAKTTFSPPAQKPLRTRSKLPARQPAVPASSRLQGPFTAAPT